MSVTLPDEASPARRGEEVLAEPRRRTRNPPALALALGTVAILFLAAPLIGLLTKVSWSTLAGDLTSPVALDALRLSLLCSAAATGLCVVLGVPLAWLLARASFPGLRLVRALALLPMVLPPVVGGVALLLAFGRNGVVGRVLFDLLGVELPFTTAGVIVAETFVALPFLIFTVEAGLRSLDAGFEEVAAVLGARPWTVFRRVTLPMIGPSLAAGAALAWARALGEFGATITFAGDIQGRTQTLPLAVYLALQENEHVAVALSLLLLAVSIVVLVSLRGRWLGGLRR